MVSPLHEDVKSELHGMLPVEATEKVWSVVSHLHFVNKNNGSISRVSRDAARCVSTVFRICAPVFSISPRVFYPSGCRSSDQLQEFYLARIRIEFLLKMILVVILSLETQGGSLYSQINGLVAVNDVVAPDKL